MDSIKILFPLAAFYPSQIGGPCNTVYWHTVALVKNGFSVTVVTTTTGIENSDALSKNKFIKLVCGSTYYGEGNSRGIKTIFTVLKEIKDTHILHLNGLFSPLSSIAFFYCKLFFRKKSLVWSVRGELSKNALKYSYRKKKPFLWVYKKIYKGITFHSTSDSETEDIKENFPAAKVVKIPNLIVPAERMNKNTSKYLLYVGRIHPIKAIHKLIRAVKLSKEFEVQNFELHIVGKHVERHSSYRKELSRLIDELGLKGKVVFRGHLTGIDKEMAYADAYGLVLPSESENFGNVVVEALNQGTPVIASLGTPWEILGSSGVGFHCSNSPQLLSQIIDNLLLTDKVKYQVMVDNCYKMVDRNFNVNTQIHQWVTLYNKLYYANSK